MAVAVNFILARDLFEPLIRKREETEMILKNGFEDPFPSLAANYVIKFNCVKCHPGVVFKA